MNPQDLMNTARTLVAGDKGVLAMDESNPTCNKRFAQLRPCRSKDCAELLISRQPQIEWVSPIILAKRASLGYLTPNPTI
jgi:fructose-bisphosphate aldolase class I